MESPIGDWGLASQAHEIETGYLGNRRGFVDEGSGQSRSESRKRPAKRAMAIPEPG